jgi:peptidoglycan/LPS O-acetylase OafA/YrhL
MSGPLPRQHGQVPNKLRSPHGAASVHLDALRGIAAVGVCWNHLRDLLLTDYSSLPHHNPLLSMFYLATGLGHQWVMIFFVLSGYLVGGSVLRAFEQDRWSWRSYLLNRMTRLYAVLIPALLLGGVLDLAGIHFFGTGGIYGAKIGSHELTVAVQTRLHLPILLGNYAFLQGILVSVFGSNAPLWSLANEFWYYLAFPLIMIACAIRSSVVQRILSVVLLVAILLFVGHWIDLYLLIWLMGVGIHFLPPLHIASSFTRRIMVLLALAATAGTLAWSKQSRLGWADWLLGAVITGTIYVILYCSHTPAPRAYKWTAHALSRSSYTLYLVHVPLIVFLASWIGRIRLQPSAPQILLLCALFLAALFYAQIVWFFFEKRTDTLREWLKPMVIRSAPKALPRPEAPVSS